MKVDLRERAKPHFFEGGLHSVLRIFPGENGGQYDGIKHSLSAYMTSALPTAQFLSHRKIPHFCVHILIFSFFLCL